MASVNNVYPATSPYSNTDVVNKKFLDIMVNKPIPAFSSDVFWAITPVYEFRPDLLAYDLYSDARLWWVFAQRNPNRLKDPYFDFITGIEIYLPKKDSIKRALGI